MRMRSKERARERRVGRGNSNMIRVIARLVFRLPLLRVSRTRGTYTYAHIYGSLVDPEVRLETTLLYISLHHVKGA
jgi:hypothetical protein